MATRIQTTVFHWYDIHLVWAAAANSLPNSFRSKTSAPDGEFRNSFWTLQRNRNRPFHRLLPPSIVFLNRGNPGLFFCLFSSFNMSPLKFKFKLIKLWMVFLKFEPSAAEWKAHSNPLSYGGTPFVEGGSGTTQSVQVQPDRCRRRMGHQNFRAS